MMLIHKIYEYAVNDDMRDVQTEKYSVASNH